MKKMDLTRFVKTGCYALFFLLYSTFSIAQNYNQLTENQKLELRLRSHLVFDISSISSDDISFLIAGRSPVALYIDDYKKEYKEIFQKTSEIADPIIILGRGKIPDDLKAQLNLLFISDEDLETIQLNFNDESLAFLPTSISKDLVRFQVSPEYNVQGDIFQRIWVKTGRMPNFIQSNLNQFNKLDSIVYHLNRTEKVFGTVKSKEGLLKEVGFKDQKKVLINGFFSFPILDNYNLPVFIPQKAGYYFSPDIIYTTPDNKQNSKEFVGFPLDADFGLTDHFIFRKTIENTIRKNDKELISNAVSVSEDAVHGKVGYFQKDAYIDAGLNSKSALQGSFTICAWIKPTLLEHNNSILGKGDNFVLKLHESFLTFTMADIKDYISQSSPIELNTWSHIALVHSAQNNELSFFVNGIQTDTIKLIANYTTSDYNILIGSNLWQEFFNGYITDIKIWDRELNANELNLIYQKINNENNLYRDYFYVAFVVIIFLCISYLIFVRFKKRKISNLAKVIQEPKKRASPEITECNRSKIYCFGTLRIVTEDGLNIANKLSPKLKQLFLIVLLHSTKGKKGISTKLLSELLWPGMNPVGVKNTRGTNIQNLRTILSSFSDINLVFKDKLWFIEIGEQCYFDYEIVESYLDVTKVNDSYIKRIEKSLPSILNILKEGRFLAQLSNDWLDPYIEQFSNRIIEWCVQISEFIQENDHLLYDLTTVINLYDDLNEHALKVKLHILIKQGKLSLAYDAYHNFAKLYQSLYSETYSITFEELISTKSI